MASSKSYHYNYFKEKSVLREEERVLKEMLGKFQDQLNRLKIEELALMSLLKMQKEQSNISDEIRPKVDTVRSLDSISDTNSIMSVIPVGVAENIADLNTEYLDLNVLAQTFQGEQYKNDFEEEEEEEDDENDTEEDGEIHEIEYHRNLQSYMDNL